MNDVELSQTVAAAAIENWLKSTKADFSAGTVLANIERTYFRSSAKERIIQIGVMTQEDSPLGEVVKDLVKNKGVVSPILLAQKETRASSTRKSKEQVDGGLKVSAIAPLHFKIQMQPETPHHIR